MIRPSLALSLVALVGASAAAAQTAPPAPSVAAPAPELRAARLAARQACAADAARLCTEAEAGHGAKMKCLVAHRADLSAGCGQALTSLREARASVK